MCLSAHLLAARQIRWLHLVHLPHLLFVLPGFVKGGWGVEEAGRGQQLPKEEVWGIETRAGESAEKGSVLPERDRWCRGVAEKTQCKIKTVAFCTNAFQVWHINRSKLLVIQYILQFNQAADAFFEYKCVVCTASVYSLYRHITNLKMQLLDIWMWVLESRFTL